MDRTKTRDIYEDQATEGICSHTLETAEGSTRQCGKSHLIVEALQRQYINFSLEGVRWDEHTGRLGLESLYPLSIEMTGSNPLAIAAQRHQEVRENSW